MCTKSIKKNLRNAHVGDLFAADDFENIEPSQPRAFCRPTLPSSTDRQFPSEIPFFPVELTANKTIGHH